MKRFAVLALGTAAVVAAPAAFAGGPVVVAPEPVVAAPAPVVVAPVTGAWEGGYVGVQLGYGDGGQADGDGALGGVHAGYRWDLGSTVLGVVGEYNATDFEGSNGLIKGNELGSLRGQIGYDLGNTLVYASAGVARADIDVGNESFNDTGYVVGLGVDYAVTPNWILGGEVSTYSFDDLDGSGVNYNPTTVALKASYKF
ncbi:outer membrane protein [Falsirhodobacter halotolerans]|uniref:outer membrane protein n=1 Tax=Falsirhodobacter halotolerans TaxID=1146892 RepID=UPI001FD3D3C4|nr:outer membrane beta-barrel protein [Falsirhodobacter halotolerans]MCJ8139631.1 outer membrane beta-barrel protein [Falsirhodobacter halotolerans]